MKKGLFINDYASERDPNDLEKNTYSKDTMTVGELANLLAGFDPDLPVYLRGVWDICGERFDGISPWSFYEEEYE